VNWFSSAWHDVTHPSQLISDGEHWLGQATDVGAHVVGRGLTDVGLGQLGNTVDGWGDDAATSLDPEMQLGQTDDPTQLIHGDPGAIRSTAGSLTTFSGAFAETASGLAGLDTSHWTGTAADAFRSKYEPEPPKWQTASNASSNAGDALTSYADTVEWAQGQAKEAIAMYADGQNATQTAVTAYNDQVNAYNAAAKAYDAQLSAGQNPGPRPVEPAPFSDPGASARQHAQAILQDARTARDAAGDQAASTVSKATDTAPASPGLWSQVSDTLSDGSQQYQLAQSSFAAGVINGVANLGKFARTLNPEDPWNIEHPAEYLAGLSGTATGLVHDAVHPEDLVGQVLGSGWGSDPAEALGNLVPQAVLAVATAGGGTAADAATDAGVDATEGAADTGDAADATAGTPTSPTGAPAGGPGGFPPNLSAYGEEGIKAEGILQQYNPTIRYTQSGGSYYDSSTNTITIDTTNGDAGVGLIHELTHVDWAQSGIHADPFTMTKPDYLNSTLQEETQGTVAQIRANQVLQQANPAAPATALQAEYETGYQAGVQQAAQQAAAQGRVLTPAEVEAAGKAGGAQAVSDAFSNGSVIGSASGTPYTDYYGNYWDQVHTPPPTPSATP
jgi:uncharacterized protein YukE